MINKIIRGLGCIEGIRFAIGLVGRLPQEQIRKRPVLVDDLSHRRQVLVVTEIDVSGRICHGQNRGSHAQVNDEVEAELDGLVDELFKGSGIIIRRYRMNLFSDL